MPSRVTRLDRPLALRYLLLGATLVAPASCGGDAKVGDQDTAVDTTVVIDDTSADVTADSADSAADTADVADAADVADLAQETATDAADSGDSADVSDDVDAVACQGASGCACDDEHACDDPLVCHDATCAACQNGWTDCPCDGTGATARSTPCASTAPASRAPRARSPACPGHRRPGRRVRPRGSPA
ncbi:MAG: hypothetical protein U1F43_30510 [Myxococcota bacterium]